MEMEYFNFTDMYHESILKSFLFAPSNFVEQIYNSAEKVQY